MRRAIIAVLAMTCFVAAAVAPAQAQPFPTVSIGFRNETKLPLIVQGYTVINGIQRRGMPLLIPSGRAAFDANVPAGPRLYSVYDGNQPARVLLRDVPMNLPTDALFIIHHSPQHPLIVDLTRVAP